MAFLRVMRNGRLISEFELDKGCSVHNAILKHPELEYAAPCGGKGTCGKCIIKVLEGNTELTKGEERFISKQRAEQGYRLACRFIPESDVTIELANETSAKISSEGFAGRYKLDPVIYKTFEDGKTVIRDITGIIAEESGNTSESIYGVAFDIGTTTVVGYLLKLNTGETLNTYAELNAQKKYGADVISRITYALNEPDGKNMLKKAITGQISSMIKRLSDDNQVKLENIYGVSITGNTTMLHLLRGLSTEGLSRAPFTAADLEACILTGGELGIIPESVRVYIMPCIAAFVGADITAAILSSGMNEADKPCLLVDIGTNGEIAFGNRKGICTCATAAGPAFEGACITHGIGGVSGAINSVKINSSGQIDITTIDNIPAIGICGSGIIDAAAVLIEAGIVDETGRMLAEDELEGDCALLADRIIDDDKIEFVLDNNTDNRITVTASDIREIQLAKAAIAAGMKVLLIKSGCGFGDVGEMFLAGGFGSYMDKGSAVKIGLIDESLNNKIKVIGNAAGAGACMYLLSKESYNKAREIAHTCEYIELSESKEFQDEYIESMMF